MTAVNLLSQVRIVTEEVEEYPTPGEADGGNE